MTKRKDIHEWMKNDQTQLDWAKEYLNNKNILLPTERGYERVLESMSGLQKETLRLMRLAWNQRDSKAKRKTKTYSFSLSAAAGKKLKEIAGKRHLSHVIEDLLMDLDKLKKEAREKAGHQLALEMGKRHRAFQDLRKVGDEWGQMTDNLLVEWSRQRTLLSAHGLATADMSEQQSLEALSALKAAKQKYVGLEERQQRAMKMHDSATLGPWGAKSTTLMLPPKAADLASPQVQTTSSERTDANEGAAQKQTTPVKLPEPPSDPWGTLKVDSDAS